LGAVTSSGEGREATDEGSTGKFIAPQPLTIRLLPLSCSCIALVLAFLGLFEWDVPLTRFVRSLNDVHLDHLTNPWLATLSDIGDRLGRGESLVIVSLILFAVGFGLKYESWKAAGWRSLLAHGAAGGIGNLVKHLVGRPRPKFMHAGNLELSPVTGVGWDSFPSGHATASFAVATVLAAAFPRWRWAILSLAIAITASRILRGSHFLTDVAAGAVIGYAIGSVMARPWREWRASLQSTLFEVTPLLGALLVLFWTIGHQPSHAGSIAQWMGAGMFFTMVGLVGHVLVAVKAAHVPAWLSMSMAQSLIGLGLGMTTGSLWVTATVLCIGLAHWLRHYVEVEASSAVESERYGLLLTEAAFVLAVLLALLLVVDLRGVLPML
jgi:membrane-associated phospholipid phosphatase